MIEETLAETDSRLYEPTRLFKNADEAKEAGVDYCLRVGTGEIVLGYKKK